MRDQYGAWPYPQIPMLAQLPSTHPFELHVAWLWDRCGSGKAPKSPRIWIAGCGTFQPYAFSVANPQADILATDLSEPSLDIARRRCGWHRRKNVRFAPVDLADQSTWPDGNFDLIECYGVLMNLPDPQATLAALATRLTERGVLRVMVYPHWSRQRIFQVQRLARLLGLTASDRHHPALLRRFMRKLPHDHPLRYAFTSYADSKNDPGVVDGFLHHGDRGFTGFELGSLLQQAGLEPGFWFHRPWAQPDCAAERLELRGRSQSFVLNYLDLWQELRTNWIVCARRSSAPRPSAEAPRAHPMLHGGDHSVRHRLRLERMRWLGGSVPTRTGDGQVVLKPRAMRELRGARLDSLAQTDHPLVLGGQSHRSKLPAHEPFAADADFVQHSQTLRIGPRAPNPLYAHLFAAFEFAERHPELGLGDLEHQMGRWLTWADPLEQRPIAFGLTPYATYQRFRTNVQEHLARGEIATAPDYGDVRVRGDSQALQRVRALLAEHPDLPHKHYDDATLRELFVLLCTTDRLFVTFDRT